MTTTFEIHEVKMVPMADLELHPEFNREIIEKTIKEIDADPNPDLFGALMGARLNGNGKIAIYDGGHRYTWLQRIGYEGLVPVSIAKETDPKKIAKLFVDVNLNRRPVSPFERYRKELYSGVPKAVFIAEVVGRTTWQIGPKAADYVVMPTPLDYMYAKDPEDLSLTVELAYQIWAGHFKSTDGTFLKGVFGAIKTQGESLDRARFIERLQSHEPFDLLARARERRTRERGTLAKNVEREILRAYRAREAKAA